ncbi:MAG: glycosyltransferase [Bryobacterales bacterium]|nr:glycosyltransferase [Bryobacterales bacterium]
MAERVLFVSPEAPYPLTGGGALRTASLLEYFARRSNLDVVLFAVEGASDPEEFLPPGLIRNVCKLRLPSHSKHPLARMTRNTARLLRGVPPLLDRFSGQQEPLSRWLEGRRYDAAIVEHFWCAPYAPLVRSHASRVYLDLHNIESEWHTRAASTSPWPLSLGHRAFAHSNSRLERRLAPLFDGILVTSSRDATHLPSHPRLIIYPNAIPRHPLPQTAKDSSLVFSGNLEYCPNQEAVRFFHGCVWPMLQKKYPQLRWRILGKNPNALPASVKADPSVLLSGPVPHAVPELARSQIAIVPVLGGSGTRVKILEAWAAGLPVVSTTIGAEGLEAVPGQHLLLADTPAELSASISGLLESPCRRAQLGAAGRTLYEGHYTWEAAWRTLDRENALLP